MNEIPAFAQRAYAIFYTQHGSSETFGQEELDWVVRESMRKKVFAVLLRAGWLEKVSRRGYRCVEPGRIFAGIAGFQVPEMMREAARPYAFTGMSAIELWSDFSYVQRSMKKSPYHLKVLRRDLPYWKEFFRSRSIPSFLRKGSTFGEHILLFPAKSIRSVERHGLRVEPYRSTLRMAERNRLFGYAAEYMRKHAAA